MHAIHFVCILLTLKHHTNNLLGIAFEALGGVHQVAVTQLKRLGAALARHSGSDEREVVSQLLQRISLHLMRGNSALISGRRPDSDLLPPELDGTE